MIFFFFFFPENRIWHSTQIVSTGMEKICMTYKILFPLKNRKKNISKRRPLKKLPRVQSFNVPFYTYQYNFHFREKK